MTKLLHVKFHRNWEDTLLQQPSRTTDSYFGVNSKLYGSSTVPFSLFWTFGFLRRLVKSVVVYNSFSKNTGHFRKEAVIIMIVL